MSKKEPPSKYLLTSPADGDTSADITEPESTIAPLVVGIGASAGGLEAFRSFFSHMPANSQFAFVLVQHLSSDHVSLLAELIGHVTTMPVTEASTGDRVEGGHVYVIPPDATLTITDRRLKVSKPAPPRAHRWPINTFFSSLAEDCGDRAVGIVLSGTGTDGAAGLRAIKENGGLTLAQSGFEQQAAMSGMPASAASTGSVDDILPAESMPARLFAHRHQVAAALIHQSGDGVRQDLNEHLQTLFQLLHHETGHDFRQYKRSTVLRRIQRRMLVRQTETIADYIATLQNNPPEYQHLFHEMLIGVTEFFRDPKSFAALKEKAIPVMLDGKGASDVLRIWVPGCATGEEAYSIAILFREAMDSHKGPKVQIFATDIDDRAVELARAGRFRAPLSGVSPERQQRWFTKDGDNYVVVKQLREMCIFSHHSVIKDPPFSRLDLVSCRNLLIYLNAELQNRLFQTLHYALRPGAFLLLGPSESITRCESLFTDVDKKHRLYTRREKDHLHGGVPLPVAGRGSNPSPERAPLASVRTEDNDVDRNVRRLLEKYYPAYVLINAKHDVVRFAGATGRYLSPSTGNASLNIFSLLHKRLREPARAAVRRAFGSGEAYVIEDLTVDIDGHLHALRLIAEPLPDSLGEIRLCALAFHETRTPTIPPADADQNSSADALRIQALEHDLESAHTQLHAAIELHESVTDELKSANEEHQSINEELQSANEELETSKEEMQSINEELQIVNMEASHKNEALTRLNSDIQNLMDSTQIATLFLSRELHITNYTPALTQLFHLRDGDRGRPITEIAARINYPELAQDVATVLRQLGVSERLLHGNEGEPIYLARMRPYRTIDGAIDGVVLTFVDVTQSMHDEIDRGLLAAIVNSSRDAIIGYTLNNRISSWNNGAERIFGYPATAVVGRPVTLLLPEDASAIARELFAPDHLNKRPEEFETTWVSREGELIPVAVTISPIRNGEGRVIAGSLIARDITERRRAEQHSRMMFDELNHRVKNTLANVQAIAMQSLATSPGMEQFQTSFLTRLQALSQTHNLLAADAWRGVQLVTLISNELAPYQGIGHASRIGMHGDDVLLTPKTALALSMALHELTTNAMKYGALSVTQGRIEVSWETRSVNQESWLYLCWQERDGPDVSVPASRGFGTRLITSGVALELDGDVALDFLPTGVRCAINVPLPDPRVAS